jgi:hypothetical protein
MIHSGSSDGLYFPTACLLLFFQMVALAFQCGNGGLGLGPLDSLQFSICHFSSGRRDDGVWRLLHASPSSCHTIFSPDLVIDDLLARWLAFPDCHHTSHPSLQRLAGGGHILIGTVVTSLIVSLIGVPAATSSISAWLRNLLSDLSLAMRRYCFSSWSLTQLINAWAASYSTNSTGSPTRTCAPTAQ